MTKADLRLVRIRVTRKQFGDKYVIKQIDTPDGKGARARLPGADAMDDLDKTTLNILDHVVKASGQDQFPGEGYPVLFGYNKNGKVILREP